MRALLIATTALISISSLANAGPLPSRETLSGYNELDANQRFLCNFGFQLFTEEWCQSSDCSAINTLVTRAATPVRGEGETVSKIIVANGPIAYETISGFYVDLYSSDHNRPGRYALTGGQINHAIRGCKRRTVQITPTVLTKGKKYWIVETAQASASSNDSPARNEVLWAYDTKETSGALQQTCYVGGCQKVPWTPISGGRPYAKVK